MNRKPVSIRRPDGKVVIHGYAYPDEKVFERNVKYKDMMFKYKAWSVNPDILEKLIDKKYKTIRFNIKPNVSEPFTLTISVEDAARHGFKDTFKGGPTWYIPEDKFTRHEKVDTQS